MSKLKTKCPKCQSEYVIDPKEIDYQFCCDDCSIVLHPEEYYGEKA
ncbi:hypothetical protein P4573_19235 [Priestia megaterium]|nr:hypothetical protein [Priestia megaterium]